jgi:hypothetical protein
VISDSQVDYLLAQNPEAKKVLVHIYGVNYRESIKDFSKFSLTCGQVFKIIQNDIHQLEIAKDDMKKNIINKLKNKRLRKINVSWKELKEMIISFNLEMSIRNNSAFNEYVIDEKDSKRFLPLSFGFVNNLRKYEMRGCENNKIPPKQTAQTK